ncbi:MAG TPA: choice-of-anchor P family protein [Candidatus Acidoferrum sp.]
MSPRPQQSFAFHANAYALNASFHRPAICQIEAQAATCVPIFGGHAQSYARDFCVPRLARFQSAHSHVSGSMQDENTATTQAITTILGLNIMDVITADRIVARLTSEHKLDEPEGHILAIGSTFENLRIAGFTFDIILRHDFLLESKTHAQLAQRIPALKNDGRLANTKDGVALCSLVEKIKTDFPGLSDADKKKHIVDIPHLGTISFAEVLSMEGMKTLTMLRFDLGSPDGGGGTAAVASTNGKPPPPTG